MHFRVKNQNKRRDESGFVEPIGVVFRRKDARIPTESSLKDAAYAMRKCSMRSFFVQSRFSSPRRSPRLRTSEYSAPYALARA